MRTFLKYILPVLMWGMLIGLFSTNTFHGNFTLKVLRALVDFFDIEISRQTLLSLNSIVRKLSHVAEYFVFTLFLWRAVRKELSGRWSGRHAWIALGLTLLLASADETHQWFRNLRTGSLMDVGINTLGALLALRLIWWRTRKKTGADTSLTAQTEPAAK